MALPMRVMKQSMKSMKTKKKAMKPAMKPVMKKKAMKKAIMKAMKAMKAMKKVSMVAKGVLAKHVVFSGSKKKTVGGLTKADLTKNKKGKIVSKVRSTKGKHDFKKSPLKKWADATKVARKSLGLTGFVPVGGKTAKGKALLAKVRAILSE